MLNLMTHWPASEPPIALGLHADLEELNIIDLTCLTTSHLQVGTVNITGTEVSLATVTLMETPGLRQLRLAISRPTAPSSPIAPSVFEVFLVVLLNLVPHLPLLPAFITSPATRRAAKRWSPAA